MQVTFPISSWLASYRRGAAQWHIIFGTIETQLLRYGNRKQSLYRYRWTMKISLSWKILRNIHWPARRPVCPLGAGGSGGKMIWQYGVTLPAVNRPDTPDSIGVSSRFLAVYSHENGSCECRPCRNCRIEWRMMVSNCELCVMLNVRVCVWCR